MSARKSVGFSGLQQAHVKVNLVSGIPTGSFTGFLCHLSSVSAQISLGSILTDQVRATERMDSHQNSLQNYFFRI